MTDHTHLKALGDGKFNPNAHFEETVTKPEAKERDYETALAVLAEAVKSFGPAGAPSDLALQMRSEAAWKWLTAENWTPPPVAPVAPQPSATEPKP